MLGVLCPGRGRFRVEQVDILGVPVLWCYIPLGGYLEKWRLLRVQRLLQRRGVRRLLPGVEAVLARVRPVAPISRHS